MGANIQATQEFDLTGGKQLFYAHTRLFFPNTRTRFSHTQRRKHWILGQIFARKWENGRGGPNSGGANIKVGLFGCVRLSSSSCASVNTNEGWETRGIPQYRSGTHPLTRRSEDSDTMLHTGRQLLAEHH